MSACVDCCARCGCIVFFFNDTATTEIYTLSLHDALPISPLRTVQTREFGASTLFYTLAQDLGIVDLINAHVPPAPVGRRTSLSVGHYLLLAAVNRAIWAKSKRAFDEWYQTTVLARLLHAAYAELSSQRFWDHMHLFEEHHFAP